MDKETVREIKIVPVKYEETLEEMYERVEKELSQDKEWQKL